MPALNEKALNVNPGIVEVAVNPGTIPALAADASNAVAVRSACDALSFTRLASVIDVKISENNGANVVEVISDDLGTIYKAGVPDVTVTGSFYEVGDVDAVSTITGKPTLNVAGSPVTVTAEAHGTGWTVGTPIKATHKNGDDTIVTSIVVKNNSTTLAAGTDYSTYVGNGVNGDEGYTYVVPLTAQTGSITFGYSYTPNAATYVGTTISSKEIPSLVVRVTSTDPATGKVKITYLIDSGFDGELVSAFVDVARAGNLEASPFSFKGNRLGTILSYTDDL